MKHVGPVDDHPHGRRLTSHEPLNLQNPWMVWCQQMPYPPQKNGLSCFLREISFTCLIPSLLGVENSHDQRLKNAAGKGGKPLQMA